MAIIKLDTEKLPLHVLQYLFSTREDSFIDLVQYMSFKGDFNLGNEEIKPKKMQKELKSYYCGDASFNYFHIYNHETKEIFELKRMNEDLNIETIRKNGKLVNENIKDYTFKDSFYLSRITVHCKLTKNIYIVKLDDMMSIEAYQNLRGQMIYNALNNKENKIDTKQSDLASIISLYKYFDSDKRFEMMINHSKFSTFTTLQKSDLTRFSISYITDNIMKKMDVDKVLNLIEQTAKYLNRPFFYNYTLLYKINDDNNNFDKIAEKYFYPNAVEMIKKYPNVKQLFYRFFDAFESTTKPQSNLRSFAFATIVNMDNLEIQNKDKDKMKELLKAMFKDTLYSSRGFYDYDSYKSIMQSYGATNDEIKQTFIEAIEENLKSDRFTLKNEYSCFLDIKNKENLDISNAKAIKRFVMSQGI